MGRVREGHVPCETVQVWDVQSGHCGTPRPNDRALPEASFQRLRCRSLFISSQLATRLTACNSISAFLWFCEEAGTNQHIRRQGSTKVLMPRDFADSFALNCLRFGLSGGAQLRRLGTAKDRCQQPDCSERKVGRQPAQGRKLKDSAFADLDFAHVAPSHDKPASSPGYYRCNADFRPRLPGNAFFTVGPYKLENPVRRRWSGTTQTGRRCYRPAHVVIHDDEGSPGWPPCPLCDRARFVPHPRRR